jgi:hypothetical protein
MSNATNDFSMLSSFLPTGVFDSLQTAAHAPPAAPVALLQQSQLNQLKRKASRQYPHLRFEQTDAKYRIDRCLKLTRIIADADNRVRVWRRELSVVKQPEAFDKAITSLHYELNLSQRVDRDRGGRRVRRRQLEQVPISSSSSSSSSDDDGGRQVRRRLEQVISSSNVPISSSSSDGDDFEDEDDVEDEDNFEDPEVPQPPQGSLVYTETDYSGGWMCTICLQSDEEHVVEPVCGHPYHHHCLMAFIDNSARDGHFKCAVCRQRLSATGQLREVEFGGNDPAVDCEASDSQSVASDSQSVVSNSSLGSLVGRSARLSTN